MYPNLIIEVKKRNITQIEIAAVAGVTRDTVRNKMERNGAFTIDEALKIREKFFPEKSLEDLFEEKIKV